MKRAFDIAAAAAALFALSPAMAVIAVAVRLKLGAPVLFTQDRPGLKGRPFRIMKFRTMTDQREASGKLLPDPERMTSFGRWLRATSLDELPELWNVLRGEMSLVGPRPLLVEYLDRYTPEERRRHEVRPGLTGWAQVNGRNAATWDERLRMDVWYVDNRTFILDLKIILRTVTIVLRREGINAAKSATMPEFRPPA
jgi:lipopolysaccharide/colanic/teichoic acid biosynthesis glycosyltransferase